MQRPITAPVAVAAHRLLAQQERQPLVAMAAQAQHQASAARLLPMQAVAVVECLTPQELPVQVAQEGAGLVARLEMAQEQRELPI
jgi:hypothetical protein